MRHNLTFLIILLFFSMNAFAQFTVGVEAGGNYSYWQQKAGGRFKTEGKYGYYVAASPGYKFNNFLTTALNLEYSSRGVAFSNIISINGVPVKRNIIENYVRISPQFHLSPIKNLAIILGPELGLSISEFSKSKGNSLIKHESKFFNDQDLGAVIGARYYFKNIFVTAKYFHGFNNSSNLYYSDEQGNLINEHQKNRNIQLGVGYRIM